MQRTSQLSPCQSLVSTLCIIQSLLGTDLHNCIQCWIHRFNSFEAGAHKLMRKKSAFPGLLPPWQRRIHKSIQAWETVPLASSSGDEFI